MVPVKSPKRAPLKLFMSPFTKVQIPWIIYKMGELNNIKLDQRAFRLKFHPKNPREVPNYMAFKRLVERFESSGGQTRPKSPPGLVTTSEESILLVKNFFTENKEAHIREASRVLKISRGQIWRILRQNLNWKAYRPHSCQVLSPNHMQVRLTCAEWFLSKDKDFFSRKVVWGDEKYFVLKASPNSQNDRFWAPENPYRVVPCKDQSQAKAMCWMGLVNGQVIGPIWLEGTMDQHMYKAMLEEHVIPLISNIREKWWMQDANLPHYQYESRVSEVPL